MSLHNPILDKAKAAGTLSAVEASQARTTQAVAEGIETLKDINTTSKTLSETIAETIEDIGTSAQTIERAKMNADLKEQNMNIDVFNAMGGQREQVALAKELLRDQRETGDLMDLKEEIESQIFTGVQLFDDIINGFRTDRVEASIKNAQAKQAQTALEIGNIAATTESAARANQLAKKTLNQGVIEANLNITAASATREAAKQRLENLKHNSDNMINLVNMQAKEQEQMLRSWELGNRKEQIAQDKVTHDLRVKQFEADAKLIPFELETARLKVANLKAQAKQSEFMDPKARAMAKLRLEALQAEVADAEEVKEKIVVSIQSTQAMMGKKPDDPITAWIKYNSPDEATRIQYQLLFNRGSNPEKITIGDDLYDSMNTLALLGMDDVDENKGTKLVATIVRKVDESGKLTRDTTPAQHKVIVTGIADKFLEESEKEIIQGDTENPFHAPAFPILEDHIAITESVLYQKVLKDMKFKDTNTQVIYEAAVVGIKAGVVTIKEAEAGIKAIFNAAAVNNSGQDGGMARVGAPNQTTYNSRLKVFVSPLIRLNTGIANIFRGLPGIKEEMKEVFPTRDIEEANPIFNHMDSTDINAALLRLLRLTAGDPVEVESTEEVADHGHLPFISDDHFHQESKK